jgi:Spy/CpxP family protein refolding chaperone
MMNRRIWSVLPIVAATLVGAVGCTQDVAGEPATAEGTAQALKGERADEIAGRHRRGPGGGPDFLLVSALHELDLSAAQKATIQGALDELHRAPRAQPPKGAPFAAVAEGVRAGHVDVAAVLAKLPASPLAPPAERTAALADAIQKLHDTLTADQREALVDGMAKRWQHRGPRGERGARAERGDRGEHARRGPKGEHAHRGGPLGFLLHDLALTDAQRDAVHAALEANEPEARDHEAMKARFEAMRADMQKRMASFEADAFDAKAFVAPPAGMDRAGKPHLERMLNALAAIVPILDPAQREQLATKLERPMGPMGAPDRDEPPPPPAE